MKEFNFRVDRLLSVWESERVTVKAENLEEAKKKLLDFDTFDKSDSELLYDTMSVILPNEKFDKTIEVFLENDDDCVYLEGVDSL